MWQACITQSLSHISRLKIGGGTNRQNKFNGLLRAFKLYTITWHSMHRQLSLMLHVRPSNAAASLYSSLLDFRRSFRRFLLTRPSFFLLPPSSREVELPDFPLLLAATSALPAGDPNRLTRPSTSCNERQHIDTRPNAHTLFSLVNVFAYFRRLTGHIRLTPLRMLASV